MTNISAIQRQKNRILSKKKPNKKDDKIFFSRASGFLREELRIKKQKELKKESLSKIKRVSSKRTF